MPGQSVNQSATRRTLLVLERLAASSAGLGLTEIAEALGLPKSVAHRILALLVEAGYAKRSEESGRYLLTLKLTILGLRHYVSLGLADLAQPFLDRLAEETGELARLALVEGERLVWVAKAQGARAGLRYEPGPDHDTGHDVVLHATATGKAWLATLPEAEALRIVAAEGFETERRFGPNAARNLAEFRARLAETRRAGHGEALEEGEAGTAAIAVAVADRTEPGRTIGTLSLAGPLLRFGPERRGTLAQHLKHAAKEFADLWPLSRRLDDARPAATGWPLPAAANHGRLRHGTRRLTAL